MYPKDQVQIRGLMCKIEILTEAKEKSVLKNSRLQPFLVSFTKSCPHEVRTII